MTLNIHNDDLTPLMLKFTSTKFEPSRGIFKFDLTLTLNMTFKNLAMFCFYMMKVPWS